MIPGFNYYSFELLDAGINNNNYIFNPYSNTSRVNMIGDCIANEEENNTYWNELSEQLIQCRYKSPENIQQADAKELGVLALNIRSIHKNIQAINDRNTEFNKYDVICLNESCCNLEKLLNGIDDLIIEGFHPPIHQAPARNSCKGGGLLTYVNKRVCNADDIESIDLQHKPSTDGEILCVKIKQCKKFNRTVIIGNVYRSPSTRNSSSFVKLFDETLSKLNRHKNKQILIAGDFNIDLINFETDTHSQDLVDAAASHGFSQIISRPTRVTDHSATLIDHVYSNKVHRVINSSVVTLDISDHLGTYVRVSLDDTYDRATGSTPRGSYGPPKNKDKVEGEYRLFNEANNENFKNLIANETWEALAGLGADAKHEKLTEIYTAHYNTAYPLQCDRKRRKHERVTPKPWITSWLEDATHRKNQLYLTSVDNPTAQNKATYDKMRKFCDKHIDIAKAKYYKKYFTEHNDNSRKQWQMINSLLNRNKRKGSIDKLVDKNGNVIRKPENISEKFNEFFSNIASDLKSKIVNQP